MALAWKMVTPHKLDFNSTCTKFNKTEILYQLARKFCFKDFINRNNIADSQKISWNYVTPNNISKEKHKATKELINTRRNIGSLFRTNVTTSHKNTQRNIFVSTIYKPSTAKTADSKYKSKNNRYATTAQKWITEPYEKKIRRNNSMHLIKVNKLIKLCNNLEHQYNRTAKKIYKIKNNVMKSMSKMKFNKETYKIDKEMKRIIYKKDRCFIYGKTGNGKYIIEYPRNSLNLKQIL